MTGGELRDNVYVIDTKMFGFNRYCSAFIVAGKEIALIDTGTATSADAVRNGIKAHGFNIADITHVIITHLHFDHSGSAGILLKEMPRASVLVHPSILKHIIDPSILNENVIRDAGQKMADRFGALASMPSSRARSLIDGEVLDIGNDVRLRIIFAPGHHPSEIVLFDEHNKNLFIGDAAGLYFADENVILALSPLGSDIVRSMETLKMLMDVPATRLFMGHYGICDTPEEVMGRALDAMQQRFDIAVEAIEAGESDKLTGRMIASVSTEIEKLRTRGQSLELYLTEELLPLWAKGVEAYCRRLQQK